MAKPKFSEHELFWVQNQIKVKFPTRPPRSQRKDFHEFAILTASQITKNSERQAYKGLLDRDDLEFLTAIPRTTLYDTLQRLQRRGDAEKVSDPEPTRLRGRKRIFYRIQPQN